MFLYRGNSIVFTVTLYPQTRTNRILWTCSEIEMLSSCLHDHMCTENKQQSFPKPGRINKAV